MLIQVLMSADTEASIQPVAPDSGPNPWKYVPVLYVLQAIPVVLIQDVSTLFYKDFGIPNEEVAKWTSLLALPWGLQFLLGPLVDLSAAKRKWVLGGQFVLTILLALLPFLLLPAAKAFSVSLIFMAAAAFCSALTNIATDGFYLLAFTKEIQARFAGIQTASFRAGRLLAAGLVPFIAGQLMSFNNGTITTGGHLYIKSATDAYIKSDKKTNEGSSYTKELKVHVDQGELVAADGKKLLGADEKPIAVGGDVSRVLFSNGVVSLGEKKYPLGLYRQSSALADPNPARGNWVPATYPSSDPSDTFESAGLQRRLTAPVAWAISFFGVALLYGVLALFSRKSLPFPAADTEPSEQQRLEFKPNLARTFTILGLYGTSYFALSSLLRISLHLFAGDQEKWKGWVLKSPAEFVHMQSGLTGLNGEIVQLFICAPLTGFLYLLIRRLLVGSEMGASLATFFRQSGIWAIVAFMFFYRFAEAMVNKAVPLFLKDPLTGGGLAFDNSQIGLVKGTVGMIGIICGGIIGGILVSKIGLKKGFWTIAILMHLPITLYLVAAIMQPTSMLVISVIEFADQFGYGLGYAGYSVYLMRVAQRGNYPTAHYAIGTGIGGSIIALAGILSGVLVVNFGYVTTFLLALLFGIPGVLTLLFIPHDDEAPATA
ncbi:MAG: hypothetical protein WCK51_15515 [Armatimonadota bacterium]